MSSYTSCCQTDVVANRSPWQTSSAADRACAALSADWQSCDLSVSRWRRRRRHGYYSVLGCHRRSNRATLQIVYKRRPSYNGNLFDKNHNTWPTPILS